MNLSIEPYGYIFGVILRYRKIWYYVVIMMNKPIVMRDDDE
tara:strand:+ start:3601 stop:3723 length:123 start_codon:yes stop_codon:yes gene_type:complete